MMKKPVINMLSSATKIKGQGVGSAYLEQVALVKKGLSDKYEILEGADMQADITHYHTIDLKFCLQKRRVTRKGKSLGYVHMLPETVENSIKLPRFMKRAFYWYMLKFYKSMDFLVTVNPYFIDELEKYGVKRSRVTYIPNYVSSHAFHPLPPDEKARAREGFGIPPEKFVVLSAGQLQVRKGIFDFLSLAEKMPEVQFVWAGGFSFGTLTDGYKDLQAVMANPPANVKFLGIIERERMNEVYNLADLMLLASFEELFPMAILEAMCVNVPVLLRDLDIYEDILFDFYSRSSDVDGFAAVIKQMMGDKDFYAECVALSKKGDEFYSAENITRLWDALYAKIYATIGTKDEK